MGFFDHLREMDKPNVAELRVELDKLVARLVALEPKAPEPTPAPGPDNATDA